MKNIAVIGSGTMGNGIAHTFAQFGYLVNLIDISDKALEKGIKQTKDKQAKIRGHFILGQLYSKKKNPENAKQHFNLVVKSPGAPFEMQFNAFGTDLTFLLSFFIEFYNSTSSKKLFYDDEAIKSFCYF